MTEVILKARVEAEELIERRRRRRNQIINIKESKVQHHVYSHLVEASSLGEMLFTKVT